MDIGTAVSIIQGQWIFLGILIVLSLTGWWFWYWYSFGDITPQQFHLIEIIVGISIVIVIISFLSGFFLFVLLPVCFPFIGWYFIKKNEEVINNLREIQEEKRTIKTSRNIIKKSSDNRTIYEAYISLGDIHFKKDDYEKALEYYKKANKIKEIYNLIVPPDVDNKIKITEKENRIKRGEIWVCPECSFENFGNVDICKNCGQPKKILSAVKRDLTVHKEEIKQELKSGIFWIITICVGGTISLWILFLLIIFALYLFKKFPWYFAILIYGSIITGIYIFLRWSISKLKRTL